MDEAITAKVWQRLVAGKSLDGIGLPSVDGRIDLRGIVAPGPRLREPRDSGKWNIQQMTNLVRLEGVSWRGLDFSNARLGSFRFFDSEIEDCRFDSAHCRDWRMWSTRITDTSFHSVEEAIEIARSP